jgi:hypothetical protein
LFLDFDPEQRRSILLSVTPTVLTASLAKEGVFVLISADPFCHGETVAPDPTAAPESAGWLQQP